MIAVAPCSLPIQPVCKLMKGNLNKKYAHCKDRIDFSTDNQKSQQKSETNLKIACQWFLHTPNASGDLQAVGEKVCEVLETSRENLLRCFLLVNILPEGQATGLAVLHERMSRSE